MWEVCHRVIGPPRIANVGGLHKTKQYLDAAWTVVTQGVGWGNMRHRTVEKKDEVKHVSCRAVTSVSP